MAGGFIFLHIIPFDGKLFDDPEQAIFSLVVLNLAVFILLILALMSVKEGRKKAAREAKARRKALKQNQSDQLVALAESSPVRAAVAKPVSKPAQSQPAKARRASRPLEAANSGGSKNYSRPAKK
jgi:ABC-type transport system involved in cytochrome bd biosynthesis fused ATPase/permease subunit